METLPAGKTNKDLKNHVEDLAQKHRPKPLEEKDEEEVGVHNLKEVIAFGIVLTTTAIDIAGDGIGPLDIIDLIRADDLRDAFGDAVGGYANLDDEVTDLSVSEGFQLAQFAWDRIEKEFL